jgi:hypothetical protein
MYERQLITQYGRCLCLAVKYMQLNFFIKDFSQDCLSSKHLQINKYCKMYNLCIYDSNLE